VLRDRQQNDPGRSQRIPISPPMPSSVSVGDLWISICNRDVGTPGPARADGGADRPHRQARRRPSCAARQGVHDA
jgi:hypothetical protein